MKIRTARIGHAHLSAVDNQILIDWRMAEVGNRWRLGFAWGQPHIPFSERYGHREGPKRWAVGPIWIQWSRKGKER